MLDRCARTLPDPPMTEAAAVPDPQGLGGPAVPDDDAEQA
jgi:hypothetical protein